MRTLLVIAGAAAVMTVLAGCPGNGAADPPKSPAATDDPPKGEPLELNNTQAAAAGECAECKQAAGAAHRCGKSDWCAKCNADIAAGGTAHVCNVSHFCKACGREAAIAGHRCGETRFDKASLSAADLDGDYEWDEFDEGEDEDE